LAVCPSHRVLRPYPPGTSSNDRGNCPSRGQFADLSPAATGVSRPQTDGMGPDTALSRARLGRDRDRSEESNGRNPRIRHQERVSGMGPIRYTRTARLLHWLMASGIVTAVAVAISFDGLPLSPHKIH